jgi:two-component system sensor histidine kinase VicK
MRWWLALAFAAIAAVTAVVVAQLVSTRSESAFRDRGAELAAGRALQAAVALGNADAAADLDRLVLRAAGDYRIALFVFDRNGDPITPRRSRNVALETIARQEEAVGSALDGERFISTNQALRGTVVALPLFRPPEAGALLAYAPHPELAQGLGIVHREAVTNAVVAFLVAGTIGLLVAALIGGRLRRIAQAAAAIERGEFERELRPRFRDEVGELAETLDRMRERLRDSFEALRSERDRLASLFERLHDGVVAIDDSLVVQVANGRARALLGESLREGDPLPDPWPSFPLRATAGDLFEPRARPVEATVEPAEGRTYALVGLPPHRGSATALLVLTDISERERRERAERDFIANASHELRTPLTTIRGAVELLQSGAKESPADRDRFLEHIDRETARLGRLTRALLLLARAEADADRPPLVPVSVGPLLAEVAGGLRLRPGVSVTVDCPAGLDVLGDPDLAEQILVNLADNAARETERGSIVLTARSRNGEVAIEVRDTGRGIPPDELERVFERFYRTNGRERDRTGLGLAIARHSATMLGGRLSLDSTPGRGTVARVFLREAA